MSHEFEDEEIVKDFLVESREILEALGEQLVELEQNGGNTELLNAVFRGFHTIKGGAGFLGLDPLVDICHRTEDLFNLLRIGERQMTPNLMDHVLHALDVVNTQFDALAAGTSLQAAPPDLLLALEELIKHGETAATKAEAMNDASDAATPSEETKAKIVPPPESEHDEITDAEFEALLDSLEKSSAPSADEGESKADDLHGKDTHSSTPQPTSAPETASAGDDMTDDEFEALLDSMHASQGGLSSAQASANTTAQDAVATASTAAPPEAQTDKAVATATGNGARAGRAKTPSDAEESTAQQGIVSRAETSVRVDTARLDDIMNLVGELVLVRNRLITQCEKLANEKIGHTVADLELVTADLQAAVMKTRMQPIKKVYGRFPRLVRDLARDLGKEIMLEMHGEDTDLDKNLVEAIADPLIHLVRNSCDHGIETPEVREAAGKPRQGKLLLSAAQEGDRILLIIADDGGGMDPEKLREKAIQKGVLDRESAARLNDQECFNLIFLPGFSTKDEISDISGRGVGMDVVRTRIAQLNGTIEIDSKLGEGTTLKVRVPLTLAILPTLMVRIGNRKFAMPMSVVSEIFALNKAHTRVVDDRRVVLIRQKAMPLYYLERWIGSLNGIADGKENQEEQQQQVVSVVLGHQPIGLIVDEVIGLEEVVIKPLGSMLHGLPGLAGSTTTGDGRIALIIDIPSLIKSCGNAM